MSEIEMIMKKLDLLYMKKSVPILFSTRIRLARNLNGYYFPYNLNRFLREKTLYVCVDLIYQYFKALKLNNTFFFKIEDLSNLDINILKERNIISNKCFHNFQGSGVILNIDHMLSIVIHEEDHLRIQSLSSSLNFQENWINLNKFDSYLNKFIYFAFSKKLGFLTSCPLNLGTGMRGSFMLHLPGLVLTEQIVPILKYLNRIAFTVRGYLGEGSKFIGNIFQISNNYTLGYSEIEIINHVNNVLQIIIKQEQQARMILLETYRNRIFYKIQQAYEILKYHKIINFDEAINLLSFIRLAIDYNYIPSIFREKIDNLFIICQPGHLYFLIKRYKYHFFYKKNLHWFRALLLNNEFHFIPMPILAF